MKDPSQHLPSNIVHKLRSDYFLIAFVTFYSTRLPDPLRLKQNNLKLVEHEFA